VKTVQNLFDSVKV